ncbi:hypothetical protein J2Y45_003954 [Dyadobacter sp. BE34]|uniref:Uncharacterized protein n=1 Tax=Dyadobacter fermentans TaxID=94254 RepID=A0ABU1R0H8_9BACT|nr:hypothetical protein [Dyadobacter fermentans]MDR7044504.1 hypothetical protein [Dyadobacter sp. BE242]MDR7198814.1 hypothetical protein [Dyadobacter sp. BE34]MDR7216776.1 hypothetical protein [Dyadobacter sp. BE31]MDR7263698.1 hypothetical protein [Dyadobacter sp. BE32]
MIEAAKLHGSKGLKLVMVKHIQVIMRHGTSPVKQPLITTWICILPTIRAGWGHLVLPPVHSNRFYSNHLH